MSIVRNLAGIAKGMSITFGEMLEPTQVENYPDGKGPLRGEVLEPRFGAHTFCSETRTGWRSAWRVFWCRGLPGELHLY